MTLNGAWAECNLISMLVMLCDMAALEWFLFRFRVTRNHCHSICFFFRRFSRLLLLVLCYSSSCHFTPAMSPTSISTADIDMMDCHLYCVIKKRHNECMNNENSHNISFNAIAICFCFCCWVRFTWKTYHFFTNFFPLASTMLLFCIYNVFIC